MFSNWLLSMSGLLDFIFDSLNIKKLSREEVNSYLNYLNEIIPQVSSKEEKIKLLNFWVRLNFRLIDLDKEQVKSLHPCNIEYYFKVKPAF